MSTDPIDPRSHDRDRRDAGELWYGEILVGCLHDVFVHQNTWFACVEVVIGDAVGQTERELVEFVAFCEDWNERIKGDDPPDAGEFYRYAGLIGGGWWVELRESGRVVVDEAPVFFGGGEVSWRQAGVA